MNNQNLKNFDNYLNKIHVNIESHELVSKSIKMKEGILSSTGALTIQTGEYTGRCPKDRYIVDDDLVHNYVNWGKNNIPISQNVFDKLHDDVVRYLSQLEELFVFDGIVGADIKYAMKVRIVNESAAQNLAISNLLRKQANSDKLNFHVNFTIYVAPNFKAKPSLHQINSEVFIIINLTKKIVLIGGTKYTGEIKKSIFTIMNYLLPFNDVLPMHCSANIGDEGDSALFFGLSGTGKTTLSADPTRKLLGDDEHGWSESGIFNFENGCYAKCINLSRKNEPQIFNAIKKGSVVENVVINKETGEYDFTDNSITDNTRVSYPLTHIANAELSGKSNHPNYVIFLTADAFGVLPPVSILNNKQAMYHFISGYTSKIAGTEQGIIEPKATFSSFFGEPFMPQKPIIYSQLLNKYITKYKTKIYLVNTGWSGGSYGSGHRMPIPVTRAILKSILKSEFDQIPYISNEILNLSFPKIKSRIYSKYLDPTALWKNKKKYITVARKLSALFKKNYLNIKNAPKNLESAGPR